MHESEMICRLFRIGDSDDKNNGSADQHTDTRSDDTPSSSGFRFGKFAYSLNIDKIENLIDFHITGYAFLIIIVIIAFVAIFLVVRHPERRETIRNLIKFRSQRSRVHYTRVSWHVCSQILKTSFLFNRLFYYFMSAFLFIYFSPSAFSSFSRIIIVRMISFSARKLFPYQ